jgi:hypothetical protein
LRAGGIVQDDQGPLGSGRETAPFDVSTATDLAIALRDLLQSSYHLATEADSAASAAAKIGAHGRR